jgi:hypothetical protein
MRRRIYVSSEPLEVAVVAVGVAAERDAEMLTSSVSTR